MIIRFFLFFILFINYSYSHEIRPAIANLNFYENNNIISAKLSIRINLEALIADIDNKYSSTQDSENSELYESLRILNPDLLKKEFDNKKLNLEKKIFLESKNKSYQAKIDNIIIPDIGNVNLARDTEITLNFDNIIEKKLIFNWSQDLGSVILRVNSKDNKDIHTEFLENISRSKTFVLDEDQKISLLVNIKNYIFFGFKHILPKGVDHILFVLALFLLSIKFKTLILQISIFTLAHTITLFLGALGIIVIPTKIVEPLIALSIAYVGIENLFKENLSKSRTIIVFLFGLLHGLGFASILNDIGLVKELFISSLISFNVGVELGQILILVLAYLILRLPFDKKKWYSTLITKPISIIISIIGIFWFFERIFF